MPDIIQAGEHQFVERCLIELWRTDMVLAWKSATNCAWTYHIALSRDHKPPEGWPVGFALRPDHVYDAFVILSLLEDHQMRQETLVVPHTGDQRERSKATMQARNARIRLYGQPEIHHYCNKCTRVYPGPEDEGVLIPSMSCPVMSPH
jgi:hypothetical protein